MGLTTDQQGVFDGVMSDIKECLIGDLFAENTFLSITGPAGTGKTFLSHSIVSELINMNLRVAVLGPTHKSLKVIRGNIHVDSKNITYATVHSFLGLKPKIDYKTGAQTFVKDKGKESSKLSKVKVDLMIVDESSFVSASLFEHIKKEALVYNRCKVVLFIGDKLQLLPVEDSNITDTATETKSAIFDETGETIINHYELRDVIRNDNTEVLDFYTDVRKLVQRDATVQNLYQLLRAEQEKPHEKIHFYENKQDFVKQYISKDRIKDESDVIVTFTNNTVDEYNNSIRNYYTKKTEEGMCDIHLNDLFVVQSGSEDFINSETIELKSFIEKDITLFGKSYAGYYCTTIDGRKFNYLKPEAKEAYARDCELLKLNALKQKDGNSWKMYYEFLGLFLDLKYVFSSTCHKSQGSSYENVYVDMKGLDYLSPNLLLRLFYVAVTRSKDSLYILL